MTESVLDAGYVFVDPSVYADEARFEAATALLRRDDPVHWVEGPGFNPFWAISKQQDIFEIETRNTIFLNEPRPILGSQDDDRRRAEQGDLLRTLIHVDDPEHRKLRGVTADWFLPKSLAKLDGQLAALARRYVDKMVELGTECDVARDISMHMPLNVILAILGLPESDYPRMLTRTQEMFGAADEDLRRGENVEDLMAVIQDFFVYFGQLTENRRAHPTEDLASVVANATIDGEPLTFDVGRSPNRHLSFGFGVHYCLGAMLARMELKALFVGGLKRLPIRYEVAPAGA